MQGFYQILTSLSTWITGGNSLRMGVPAAFLALEKLLRGNRKPGRALEDFLGVRYATGTAQEDGLQSAAARARISPERHLLEGLREFSPARQGSGDQPVSARMSRCSSTILLVMSGARLGDGLEIVTVWIGR